MCAAVVLLTYSKLRVKKYYFYEGCWLVKPDTNITPLYSIVESDDQMKRSTQRQDIKAFRQLGQKQVGYRAATHYQKDVIPRIRSIFSMLSFIQVRYNSGGACSAPTQPVVSHWRWYVGVPPTQIIRELTVGFYIQLRKLFYRIRRRLVYRPDISK